eukprot:4973201-Pyramimonas_sp.AAC.1
MRPDEFLGLARWWSRHCAALNRHKRTLDWPRRALCLRCQAGSLSLFVLHSESQRSKLVAARWAAQRVGTATGM